MRDIRASAIASKLVWGVSLVPIALTLLPIVKTSKWWVRVWDYPRQQLAMTLVATAALQALALPRRRSTLALAATTLASLAWHAWQIAPYTRLHRVQVKEAERPDPDNTLSLVIANVYQDNRKADAFLRVIERADPDLVLALETDHWWDAQLTCRLGARYSDAVRHPMDNTYGLHLFSRLPLRGVSVRNHVTHDIPSVFARVRLRSGEEVALYGLHPRPPRVGDDVEERDAELLLVAREVADAPDRVIVCGDLNDVAWSHTTRLFQRVSGLLDPRVGRGLYPTFHADHRLARWPLDHVFHGAAFRLERLEVLGHIGSDHFPVYARLVYDPSAPAVQPAPAADRTDHQEASEKIREGVGTRD